MPSKVKSLYAGAAAKKSGTFELSEKLLRDIGRVLVRAVRKACRQAQVKQQGTPRVPKQKEGLPKSPRFANSFTFRIRGKRTIEITSSWKWSNQIMEGVEPFPMTWKTREKGANIVPIRQRNGVVVYRMAPETTAKAWMHPGFSKNLPFVEKAISGVRGKIVEMITQSVTEHISGTP